MLNLQALLLPDEAEAPLALDQGLFMSPQNCSQMPAAASSNLTLACSCGRRVRAAESYMAKTPAERDKLFPPRVGQLSNTNTPCAVRNNKFQRAEHLFRGAVLRDRAAVHLILTLCDGSLHCCASPINGEARIHGEP